MAHAYGLVRQVQDERDLKFAPSRTVILPRKKDIRAACPPVFDQGSLGSCTANAGVTAYMMWKNTEEEMSRLYLYYVERYLEGTVDEDSGAMMRSIGKALNKFGVCTEHHWPYDIEKYKIDPPYPADKDALGRRVPAYKALSNLQEIKEFIVEKKQPVMAGIAIYDSFEREDVAKTGIVPMPNTRKEQLRGGHAILIVGYDDDFDKSHSSCFLSSVVTGFRAALGYSGGRLLCRNSWGMTWGDNGYFWLPYEFVGQHAYDFWVLEG